MATYFLCAQKVGKGQGLRPWNAFSKNHFFCMRQKKRFLKSKEKRSLALRCVLLWTGAQNQDAQSAAFRCRSPVSIYGTDSLPDSA